LRLFEKLSTEAVVNKEHFKAQEVANFLWACATVGHTDQRLFSALTSVIASKLDKFNEQELANITWTYSVANTPSQDLFGEGYVSALASNENEFSVEHLAQLHQWQLWQQELESGMELPQSLQAKCRNAFTSRGYSESKLQNDVVDELKAVGLDLEEEVLLGSGYRIDALVKIGDGRRVAVEVDGPRRNVGPFELLRDVVGHVEHVKEPGLTPHRLLCRSAAEAGDGRKGAMERGGSGLSKESKMNECRGLPLTAILSLVGHDATLEDACAGEAQRLATFELDGSVYRLSPPSPSAARLVAPRGWPPLHTTSAPGDGPQTTVCKPPGELGPEYVDLATACGARGEHSREATFRPESGRRAEDRPASGIDPPNAGRGV
ncbi:hypothetical protein THAOC_28177, partial [Thalassiosira oceanica]